ncbi:BREX-1 system adenine-specific DNA-methyltransferase PglX [Deinococcus sp. MIMF12]|uniref:site-specific DNA-methyltransferase (adenine-specific) n=1 Tax=Deinococcus rhizophilus TaxID=3049544 RepID=A0ABT7JED1_9DEIO|nr:BREX-1 system adenine-specific DNA-methyltransferase PglX [Deinococcus rhizophilus]MDL2342845.1 BREX-1 system adenine-specific DNA-methyltransferase PglX [Deinococcus rhizophilus]
MNRTSVKNFAQWGRRHLHDLVRARLALFGVTDKGIETPARIQGGLIIGGQTLTLSATDIGQYDALIRHYQDLSGTPKDRFLGLVDEIAYTWFNRLAALRYMEVHGYAERALSSDTPGQTDPNLLRDAVTLADGGDLGEHVTPDVVAEWQRLYEPREVYRRLLVAYAGTFAHTLPFLFGRDRAWLDLFLPDTLLNQDSIVRRMVADIPEEDWGDIEIVGWLYQFYISERKDEVFAQKGKYTPRDIPAATQLFTPHWIVRYMVENSLGRVWLEAHPDSTLREHMPYYLESENPAPPPNPDLTPESLSVMDPACGSGHILVYAFDLLAHIYREQGHSDREIPALILEHNLHGLDIDERAAQLASFAVVMKARELNSRLFRRDMPTLNILQVKATRGLRLPNAGSRDMLGNYSALSGGLTEQGAFNPNDWQPLVDAFADADHLGSLITPPEFDAGRLRAQLHWLEERGGLDAGALDDLRHLLRQAELLGWKYDAVVANPPYVANTALSNTPKSFIENVYIEVKQDIFAVFIYRALEMTKITGHTGFMTPFVWMFISSYENLRLKLISAHTLTSLIQLEYSGFEGATVPVCTFTIRKLHIRESTGEFVRLSSFKGPNQQEPKALEAIQNPKCPWRYRPQIQNFKLIPGYPIAYWANKGIINLFRLSRVSDHAELSVGMQTSNNDKYLRLWHEVKKDSILWNRYNKGGDYRRWYGNLEWLVRSEMIPRGGRLHFALENPTISWSRISSSRPSFRYYNKGVLFDSASPVAMTKNENTMKALLSLLNSRFSETALEFISPTLNFQTGDMGKIPADLDAERSLQDIDRLIQISKTDWDNFETSWDFQTHPLLRHSTASLPEAFSHWEAQSEAAFRELQRLEEENNRYWIDAYGLGDELTPEVPDDQITIRRADLGRDVRSLLSYAVGCMMGRYSLDEPGLIHAGQPFDPSRHTRFPADRDGILPVPLGGHFEDDVTARFAEFLRVAFAPERVAENMEWVAASLGGQRAGETAEARIRRYFATEFMSDHIQTYKKRPIYWLFTSGKKRGFGALVYLHRYGPDTLARLRTDYLMPLQRKLDADLERVGSERDAAGSTAAKKAAEKRLKEISEQIAEVHKYDESLRHAADLKIPLDLDDGVAYNYWLMSAAGLEYLTGKPLKGLQDLVYTGTDLKLADLERKSQWKRDLLAQERGEEIGA